MTREQAIQIISEEIKPCIHLEKWEDAINMAIDALSGDTRTGEWEPITRGEKGYSAGDFRCSFCGKPNKCYTLTDFCPNCGADMRGAERTTKVYIAGPITGVEGFEDNFRRASDLIRSKGMDPVDPCAPGQVEGASYKYYIDRGLRLLEGCDAIALLPGWEYSKGAILEEYYARICGLRILFVTDDYKRVEA